MTRVILISQSPLPATKIGSWPTLYKNYLKSDHKIDIIICKKPEIEFKTVEYQFIKVSVYSKVESYLKNKTYLNSLRALSNVVKKDTKYIIQVVDNFKIISEIEKLLLKKGIRSNCYIQFFYHGFAPYLVEFESVSFFAAIDEMILLTNDSYIKHKIFYNTLPCRFSILPNGIDKEIFYKVNALKKNILKEELNLTSKNVFIWCSQDRPKKGLDLILDVWKRVFTSKYEMVLLVIGCTREVSIEGVIFLGKIANTNLPKYYQVADVYLFPTLWQEGFGLSLVEALHCNCFCIASNIGGVSEVLENGNLGMLINKPHIISEWVDAVNFYLKNKPTNNNFSGKLYTSINWNKGMNEIIEEAKLNLD